MRFGASGARPILKRFRLTTEPIIKRLPKLTNYLKNTYGLTPEDKQKMLAEQNNCCAICEYSEPGARGNVNGEWYVDHDHVTGKVRGLLCNRCNAALGFMHEDIWALHKMIRYSQNHTTST